MSNLELVDTGFGRKQWFLIDRSEDTCCSCKKTCRSGFYCKICDKFWCEDCERDYLSRPKQIRGHPVCGCQPSFFEDHHSFLVTCNKEVSGSKKKKSDSA